jgi:hypothetical protein
LPRLVGSTPVVLGFVTRFFDIGVSCSITVAVQPREARYASAADERIVRIGAHLTPE